MKKVFKNQLIVVLFLFFSSITAYAQTKILLMGNSYIYSDANRYTVNFLKNMISANNKNAVITTHFAGGKNLTYLWSTVKWNKDLGISISGKQLIANNNFDVVVFQGHTNDILSTAALIEFENQVSNYNSSIRAKGGKPMLFGIWGTDSTNATKGIYGYSRNAHSAYLEQANKFSMEYTPTGLGQMEAYTDYGSLLFRDPIHSSKLSSYLMACSLYISIFSSSPVGFPPPAGITAGDASYMQNLAVRLFNQYGK